MLAFVADFANLPLWDWSAARVERIAGSGIAIGNRYRVHLGVGPVTTALDYEVMRYVPGEVAQLVSRGGGVESVDTIVVGPSARGTMISYTAELTLGFPGDWFAVLARPLFALHGRVVMGRLHAVLDREALARG